MKKWPNLIASFSFAIYISVLIIINLGDPSKMRLRIELNFREASLIIHQRVIIKYEKKGRLIGNVTYFEEVFSPSPLSIHLILENHQIFSFCTQFMNTPHILTNPTEI